MVGLCVVGLRVEQQCTGQCCGVFIAVVSSGGWFGNIVWRYRHSGIVLVPSLLCVALKSDLCGALHWCSTCSGSVVGCVNVKARGSIKEVQQRDVANGEAPQATANMKLDREGVVGEEDTAQIKEGSPGTQNHVPQAVHTQELSLPAPPPPQNQQR